MKRIRGFLPALFACLIIISMVMASCAPGPAETTEPVADTPAAEKTEAPSEPVATEEAAAPTEDAAGAKEGLVFAVVPKITHPFYDDVLIGLEEKAEELGVEVQWVAPPTGNPAEQVQILEDLINKGVDGIGLAPLDAASVGPVIEQAKAAGIPVVTFDSDAPDSARVAYYGTSNREAGRTEAKTLAEAIGGKGKVALVTGSLVMANLNERLEGAKEVFAEYPDIEIVDVYVTDDDFAKGLEVCEAMLRAHPDLNGVAAVSMTGAVAMAKILADPAFADYKDKVVVLSFDDFEDTMKGLEAGTILATMVQRPQDMGRFVVQGLYDLNAGGTTESVDTGVTVVTKENMGSYK